MGLFDRFKKKKQEDAPCESILDTSVQEEAPAKEVTVEKETAVKETAKKPATKKTATKTATETAEKKAPAKKAAPKKTAPKKVAPKKPTPVETKVNFFVEFGGVQVSIDEVVNNIKTTLGKDAKEISVYLKPEESKAYFVADDESSAMDVFFC